MAGTDTDLRDCTQSARTEAWRSSFGYSAFDHPRYYRGPNGQRYYDPFPMRRDSTFDEWQLRDYCMRNKGYKLVPVPEPTGT